jgi:hypothetical protein
MVQRSIALGVAVDVQLGSIVAAGQSLCVLHAESQASFIMR